MFYFHPYLGKISNLTIIFFKGVETTNQISTCSPHPHPKRKKNILKLIPSTTPQRIIQTEVSGMWPKKWRGDVGACCWQSEPKVLVPIREKSAMTYINVMLSDLDWL